MSARKLYAILIAFALLLAPAFSRVGEAYAAAPDAHHTQMAEGGHCQSTGSLPQEEGKAAAKSCCPSMCMSMALGSRNRLEAIGADRAPAAFVIRSLHLSHLGEIATPPPKLA